MVLSDGEMEMVLDHLCEMLGENPDPVVSSYMTELDVKLMSNAMDIYSFDDEPPEREEVARKIAILIGCENELRRLTAAVLTKNHIVERTGLAAIIPGFEQGIDGAGTRKPWDQAYRVRIPDLEIQIIPRPIQLHHELAHITNREYDVTDRDDLVGVVRLDTRSEESEEPQSAMREVSPEVFVRSAYSRCIEILPRSVQEELVVVPVEDAVEEVPMVLRENRDLIVDDGIFSRATVHGFAYRRGFVHKSKTDVDKKELPDNIWVTELEELSEVDSFFSDVSN